MDFDQLGRMSSVRSTFLDRLFRASFEPDDDFSILTIAYRASEKDSSNENNKLRTSLESRFIPLERLCKIVVRSRLSSLSENIYIASGGASGGETFLDFEVVFFSAAWVECLMPTALPAVADVQNLMSDFASSSRYA